MKLRYAVLIMAAISCQLAVSQTEDPYGLPRVVMPEPSAAEFIRQEIFPVSNHTGTANVTVPIYLVKSGDIEFPITATYNTNGIKVDQEASWIGLGWNLNVGGTITRVINGRDDLGEHTSFGRLYNNEFPDFDNLDSYVPNTCFYKENEVMRMYVLLNNADEGQADLQPDYFYFNFGSQSGKFILPRVENFDLSNYKPILYGESNVDIQLVKEELPNGGRSFRFIITDTNGIKYYFGTKEGTATGSTTILSDPRPEYKAEYRWSSSNLVIDIDHTPLETSTWHLDSIVSLKGDVVNFKYKDKVYITSRNKMFFDYERYLGDYSAIDNTPGSYGRCNNVYSGSLNEIYALDKISFKNGEIDFLTEDRVDVERDQYYSTDLAQRLTKIKVKSTWENKVIKEIDFEQDYFGEVSQNSRLNYNDTRLKLNAIIIRDELSKIKQPYEFTYYPGELPSKESFSQDHWGYYNGKSNNHLVPSKGFNDEDYNILLGANRDPSFEHALKGVLESVSYPTKGKSTFKYGPHIIEYKDVIAPTGYQQTTLTESQGSNDVKLYAFYLSQDDIDLSWDVQFQYNGSPISNCENFVGAPDSEENALGGVFSSVLDQPTNISYLNDLYEAHPNSNSDLLIEITDNAVISEVQANYFEGVNPRTDIAYDVLPNDMSGIICRGDIASANHPLKLKKGWYVFYAAKPYVSGVNKDDFKIDAILTRPVGYKEDVYKKYGPGLRVEQQELETDRGVEVTNYQYGSGLAHTHIDSLDVGVLITEPQYSTVYKAKSVENQQFNDGKRVSRSDILERSIHAMSSSTLGTLGSIENMNSVGYAKVTVSKNNNFGSGKSVYYYDTVELDNQKYDLFEYSRIPLNLPPNAGKLIRKEQYTQEEILLSETQYEYQTLIRGSVIGVSYFNRLSPAGRPLEALSGDVGFIPALDLFRSRGCYDAIYDNYLDESGVTLLSQFFFNSYKLKSKVNVLVRSEEKTYSTAQQDTLEMLKITKYKYNNSHTLPIETTTYIARGDEALQTDVVRNGYLTYSNRDKFFGTPTDVEQFRKTLGDDELKFIGGQSTVFNDFLLPSKIYQIHPKGDQSTRREQQLSLVYDDTKNLISAQKQEGLPQKYYWGYNEAYPVIQVVNGNLGSHIQNALPSGYSSLEDLLLSLTDIATNASQQQRWQTFNAALRANQPNAMFSTYTYSPLVGVTSKTDPRGYTTYYVYDALQRLSHIKDANGHIISHNQYHYKE